MAFYLDQSHHRGRGATNHKLSPFETVAEEFLNGLLCHYEPPPNKRLMTLTEIERHEDQLTLRRPPSILKTSSSFDGSNKRRTSKGRYVRFSGIIRPSSNDKHSSGQRSGGFLRKLKRRRKASF